MDPREVYRETRSVYLDWDGYASPLMLQFAVEHAGQRILDVGCATGEYCVLLTRLGFSCVGADYNPDYVRIAREKHGVEAHCVRADTLEYADKSFDTVLLFEILEHLKDPGPVLREARRVARKNVLITTPDCTDLEKLKRAMLTYRHTLEREHVLFFTKADLEELLAQHFTFYRVEQREPIWLHAFLPWVIRKPISLLHRVGLLAPAAYNRLYAVATVG